MTTPPPWWPQAVIAGMLAAEFLLAAVYHGKPRRGRFDVRWGLIDFCVWVSLLHAGGFWAGIRPW